MLTVLNTNAKHNNCMYIVIGYTWLSSNSWKFHDHPSTTENQPVWGTAAPHRLVTLIEYSRRQAPHLLTEQEAKILRGSLGFSTMTDSWTTFRILFGFFSTKKPGVLVTFQLPVEKSMHIEAKNLMVPMADCFCLDAHVAWIAMHITLLKFVHVMLMMFRQDQLERKLAVDQDVLDLVDSTQGCDQSGAVRCSRCSRLFAHPSDWSRSDESEEAATLTSQEWRLPFFGANAFRSFGHPGMQWWDWSTWKTCSS